MIRAHLLPCTLICLLAGSAAGSQEPLRPAGDDAIPLQQRLAATIQDMADLETRVTGYPGALRASNYVKQRLRAAGINEIHVQTFPLPVPVDAGFVLQASDQRLTLHGVWPNLVRTSSLPLQGLRGNLADGGDDVLTHLDGKPVRDRIVLLDYDSGTSWTAAMHLGARAVIFLATGRAHRKEGAQKFLAVPADFPRFYADAATAAHLRILARTGTNVHIDGRMPWRRATGHNIIGIIPGSDPDLRHEAILLGAHYDAMSPIPAVAPGADQASSAAALFELTRVLVDRQPKRSIVLVLTDGHFQNLAGMRALMPLIMQAAGRRQIDIAAADSTLVDRLAAFEIRMFVGLDLSSGSDLLSASKPVTPYRHALLAPPISRRLMALGAAYEDSARGGRRMLGNGLRQDLTRQGMGSLPHVVPVDAAVASLAGCPALVMQTMNDGRPRFDSPLDLPTFVDTHRLAQQVELLTYVLPRLWDDKSLEDWDWGNDAFGIVRGEVVHYGPRSYLPDQPTPNALVRLRLRQPTMAGVRPDVWALADTAGHFVIPGVETRIIYTQPVRVEAYGIDPVTGAIHAAPDWGINGERRLPQRALLLQMDDLDEQVQIVTAPMRALTLANIFDPRNLHTPERPIVIDARTEAEPPVFGVCMPLTAPEMNLFGYKNHVGSWGEPAAVLFMPPATQAKIVMTTGVYGIGRRLLLLNGNSTDPEGIGYNTDGATVLAQTAYHVARDLQTLNDERISALERHGVRNARLATFNKRSAALLTEAELARQELRHRDFIDLARRAWSYGISAYRDVQDTRGAVVQGALFLLAMLIPFAHFAERLFFGFVDVRHQVIAYFGIFLVSFLVLSQLHPAFELAVSPVVILLGFVILSLGLLVTGIGLSRLNRELKQMAQGPRHAAGLRRGGTMATSVGVGLANLRRRVMRTGLTCLTLVLLTFAVLSFTSIQATVRANWVDTNEPAPYSGALLRLPGWEALQVNAWHALRDRFGADHVVPRAWMSVASLASSYRIERNDDSGHATGVLGFSGLTAGEASLVGPQRDLAAGRWLAADEEDSCVLPIGIAAELGIDSADMADEPEVRIFGEVFRVVGLLAPGALDRVDLNGESLTPLDPEAQKPTEAKVGGGHGTQTALYTHLPGDRTAVLPCATVLRWEQGMLVSIAIGLNDDPQPRTTLQALSQTLDLDLFVGVEGRRYLVSTVGVATVSGLGSLIVPVMIAALVVLNTMIGAVYERTREIGIFNAIGLAPNHVSGLFIAEAVALAVISAVLGYLLGQTAAQAMGYLGLLQGLELNYSSLSAVVTLGLVIGLVVASALYPAYMAGQICTPGIERRWRPPAPRDSRIHMTLPFTLVQRDAMGMTAFQAEFWQGHQEQSIGAGFYVESLQVTQEGDTLCIRARTWLAPFDQGVVQRVTLTMRPGETAKYFEIEVALELVTGDMATWSRVSRTFLDDLRKQFLLWRALSQADRETYRQDLPRWLTSAVAVATTAQA